MAGTGSRTLKLSILGDIDNLKKSLNQGSNDVQSFGDKVTKFGKIAGAAFLAAGAAASVFAVKFGKDAIMAASDLNETISKTGVLFGDSAKQVEAFAASAGTALGQSKQQALNAAATFATFGKSAGLAGDDLVNFSTNFVGLASDLASFNNTSPEQAINAIGSALRGEAEPLRAYGVLLDDASLRQAALSLGIISTTKNALTPQQKVLAAQELIYQQTGAAQGDFARTADGLANSQRILSAQISNVTTTIGTALLPIATELFGFIGTNLIPLIQDWSAKFSETLKPAVEDISTFFKDDLLPIFQTWWAFLSDIVIPGIVNTFKPILEGLFEAFGSIADSIQNNSDKLEPFFNLMKNIGTFIIKTLAPAIGTVLGAALKVIGVAVGALIGLFANLVSIINGVVTAIQAVINLVRNNPLVKGIGSVIDNVFGGGRATGGAVSAGTTYLVGERGPELFTPNVSGGITPNNKMSGGGGTTINLNVTGAIDPEGTARTIINALNSSFYRGTGGATALVVA